MMQGLEVVEGNLNINRSIDLKNGVMTKGEIKTSKDKNNFYRTHGTHPEATSRKIRKSGMGCPYQIKDNLWEDSFFSRLPNGKRKKFNVYAETKEQCEIKLAEMIERVKAEIAEEIANLKEGAE
jgi:hypothetical protein